MGDFAWYSGSAGVLHSDSGSGVRQSGWYGSIPCSMSQLWQWNAVPTAAYKAFIDG